MNPDTIPKRDRRRSYPILCKQEQEDAKECIRYADSILEMVKEALSKNPVISQLFTPYGQKPLYLVARVDVGGVAQVLPMFLMESWVFGRKLVSVPFAPYGGVFADGAGHRRALVDEGEQVAREFFVSLIENGDTMRYVVKVDELSPEMLMNLKKEQQDYTHFFID